MRPWCSGLRREHCSPPGSPGLDQILGAESQHRNSWVRRLAFKSAMTSKLNAGEIVVVDKLELKEAKTKLMAETLKKLQAEKKALVILPEREENIGEQFL